MALKTKLPQKEYEKEEKQTKYFNIGNINSENKFNKNDKIILSQYNVIKPSELLDLPPQTFFEQKKLHQN